MVRIMSYRKALLVTPAVITVVALGVTAPAQAGVRNSHPVDSASLTAASASPASAAICTGTSLVTGHFSGVQIRVPTVGNDTGQWQCDLLPSDAAGLVPVERLQIDLNDCYLAGLTVDGEYGPDTENAVRAVQAEEGVSQDGDYGPQTIEGGFAFQERGQPTGFCDTITAIS
jgi:hypothetical protein